MLILLALMACAPDSGAPVDSAGVAAIVDPSRAGHFFDAPFPDDALLDAQGFPDLEGYPVYGSPLAADVIEGWRRRLERVAQGFGNLSPAYFRFEGPLELPASTLGQADDPVLLIDVETGELLPLVLRFTTDPGGDPYLASNLMALAPAIGHPPRSGATLAAIVTVEAGARAPQGWEPPALAVQALERAGLQAEIAVATVYTVQDVTGQMARLVEDADLRIAERADWGTVQARRVRGIAYSLGQTPSGQEATVLTVDFEDGGQEVSYQSPLEAEVSTHAIDMADWPMAVWQLEIPVFNYSGLEDRPYMDPGFSHIFDVDRDSGWITFSGGELTAVPDEEPMRVTVSIPKGEDGLPIEGARALLYDHGTGGTAWHAVQRRNSLDDGEALAQILADQGVAIIGRDQPLYGTRYPLIDEGYGGSLGFYNIVNLPAFRDNQRQGALEAWQLRRFVEQGLNEALSEGAGGSSVDTTRFARLGHSLGSVTLNTGSAVQPEAWEASFLSGSGGLFTHYFLDTGLIDGIDPSLLAGLFGLFGAEVPEQITAAAALGAALGLPEQDWAGIDRLHPAIALFQWTMDPSDPMALARDQSSPSLILLGEGDLQVPNFTTEALHEALPDSELVRCTPTADYDGHFCLHREPAAWEVFEGWLEGWR